MIIQAMSEVATVLATLSGTLHAEGISNVCPKAPAGVSGYVNDIISWVKYGVIALIIGAGFASIGAMVVGKIGSNGRAAQIGASGMFWTVLGAIGFVVIYGVLNGIVGKGC